MTTKLVRLSLEAIDAVKQHDPHHSTSQGILIMHRKLTEGLPMLQGKVNEGLTEEQEERITNLIIALFKKHNSLPSVNSSKPSVNSSSKPEVNPQFRTASAKSGTEMVNGVMMKYHYDSSDRKVWEKAGSGEKV